MSAVNPASPRLTLGFIPQPSLPYFAESTTCPEGRAGLDTASGPR